MRSIEHYNKPSGYITMILHKGGDYDLSTGKVVNGLELDRREFKNLIVNSASSFMAARMAPGKVNGKIINSSYSAGITGGEFETCGLKCLAIGVGPIEDDTRFYDPIDNDMLKITDENADNYWDLQNPPEPILTDSSLRGECFRKEFTDWKFLDSAGNISNDATNILMLSTTFLENEAVAPLTEMGLFGGESADLTTPKSGRMFNYKTFAVWNKPNDARLTVVWRLTF